MSRNVGFHMLLAASLVAIPAFASAAAAPAPAAPAAPAALAASPSPAPAMDPDQARVLARNVLTQLQNGRIDNSMFTDAMNAQLTDAQLQTLSTELRALGQPYTTLLSTKDEGSGMTTFTFWLHASVGAFDEILTVDQNGKVAGINFARDTSH